MTGYASPRGALPLRVLLARRMADQGIEAGPDQILLTDSGTHALDLVCRFLLQSGDAVLVDDPCYFNFLALLRAHRAEVIGVPMTPTGPDVTAFAEAAAAHRPRFLSRPTPACITRPAPPSAHRPRTAFSRSPRRTTWRSSRTTSSPISSMAASPRLAAFDGLDRTIRIGSFSKSLSAAVRCGHIAALRDPGSRRSPTCASPPQWRGSPLAATLLHAVLTD
ncbi:aminotransferase class I/II-fold pyridoxal phosphate-dependent enzyme [Sphingomonas sp. MMS24-JH45]